MGGGVSKKYSFVVDDSNSKKAAMSDWIAQPTQKLAALKNDQFVAEKPIGKGKFGFVYLTKHNPSGKYFAVKYVSKQFVFDTQALDKHQQELEVLMMATGCPFIIHCFGGFVASTCFAMVFEYAAGGELYNRMKHEQKFSENASKFYFCEIALALHHLHDNLGVVYRDIKPENILIAGDGHVKLCDFGFAVSLRSASSAEGDIEELKELCGTAMYVSPEIAGGSGRCSYGFPVDWWGLGCVLMEMVTGEAPFGDSDNMNKFEIFNNINHKNVGFPVFMSSSLKDVLKGLLNKDPNQRLSYRGVQNCAWLQDVVWDDFQAKRITPPWVPIVSSAPSAENFVKWNFSLPTSKVGPDVEQYCSNLRFPKINIAPGGAPAGPCTSSSPQARNSFSGNPATTGGGGGGGGGGGMEKRTSKSNIGTVEKRNSKANMSSPEKRMSSQITPEKGALEKRNSKLMPPEKRNSKAISSQEKRVSKVISAGGEGEAETPDQRPNSQVGSRPKSKAGRKAI